MLFTPSNKFPAASSAESRRGMVLIAVMVVFAIALALFGVWARAALHDRRRIRNQQFRLQAVRLAEAGVRRSIARRASDPQYEEETWQVAAEMLDQSNGANVRIRVARGEEMATLVYEATAEFPAGAVRRAQITRQIEIPNAGEGDES